MDNKFVKAVNTELNYTVTENGQLAYKSTDYSKVLDFFAVAGALRTRSEREIEDKMRAAFDEDAHLAVKLMFYLGDVREGLGERRTFRVALHWLAVNHPDWANANLPLVPFYSRWDNVFVLKDTPCEERMLNMVKWTLESEYRVAKIFSEKDDKLGIGLLAKWMPSINASPNTRKLGLWFVKKLGYKEPQYRKMLSTLRAYLKVVETQMSANNWEDIDYSHVPSIAMSNYRKAFYTHDEEGFEKYISLVKENKATIHASTLYPYNIVEKVLDSYEEDDVLELQWKALPNYVDEKGSNVLVVADVSGSMAGRPMATSVGLAIYFAERNHGPYQNLFMAFSDTSEFIALKGNTLREKVLNAEKTDWGYSTNLAAAYEQILNLAVNHDLSDDDLPKALIIISDMEVNCVDVGNRLHSRREDFMTTIKKKYEVYGYTVPTTVFWNVESRHDTFLTSGNEQDIILASGQSPSVFKNIMDVIDKTPYEAMLKYLNSERYSKIRVPE